MSVTSDEPGLSGLPLAGVRVLGFEQYIAGPSGTQILGELGADVLKVEKPSGDPSRGSSGESGAMFRAHNRGKRSIALDLGEARDREIALGLVRWADVVVSNLRPGVLESFNLDASECCRQNPNLVYVSVSGFGSKGPSRNRPALDIAIQAESGIMFVTGESEGEPQRVGFAVVDAATGMAVAQAAMAGLLGRQRNAHGGHVEVSMLQVAMHLQAVGLAGTARGGQEPIRKGNGQPTLAPAADVIATRDGFIVISAYEAHHWERLCDAIGRPELVADPRFKDNEVRVKNRTLLLEILSSALGTLSTSECVQLLSAAGIVNGGIRSYGEVLRNEDVMASGALVDYLDENDERHVSVGVPFHSTSWGERPVLRLPKLGEFNEQVHRLVPR